MIVRRVSASMRTSSGRLSRMMVRVPETRVILVGATLLALIACSPAAPTVTGNMGLYGGHVSRDGDTSCVGVGGYEDMHDGAEVVVKDGAGVIIGTGRLVFDPAADQRGNICIWTFSVPTKTSDFYSVSIGRRDALNYSAAEMQALGWDLRLTLGP